MRAPTKWLVLILALSLSLLARYSTVAYGATPSSDAVYIDTTLFAATVPSQMILGNSYSAQVLVVNNSSVPISGTAVLELPQQYFFTDNPSQPFSLPVGDRQLILFKLIADNVHTGNLNITAIAFVNVVGAVPVESGSATVTVNSIVRSPLVNDLILYSAFLAIAIAVGYVVVRLLRKPKGGIEERIEMNQESISLGFS